MTTKRAKHLLELFCLEPGDLTREEFEEMVDEGILPEWVLDLKYWKHGYYTGPDGYEAGVCDREED